MYIFGKYTQINTGHLPYSTSNEVQTIYGLYNTYQEISLAFTIRITVLRLPIL